ncbi:tyrosine-type recombinase/integrase [Candidatus Lokiarchaeum ossiferum]|uniref:tyrosine-type recombinase/integrase n=1 Tax=Candidatus Lokiarchaeum ossiferum TaxID=2951803 RepID=UPI00352C8DF2
MPIEKELAKELRSFIGTRKIGYVFESKMGKTRFTKYSVIRFVNKYSCMSNTIGKTIGTHSLRRTFASQMAKMDVPIGNLTKSLGHKDIKTTCR